MTPRVAFELHPRQVDLMDAVLEEQCDQVLFGGAAGGGKSEALRAIAFTLANAWPGARIPIFRDNYTQLQKTQVREWHRKMTSLGFEVKDHWSATTAEWHFKNPPDPRTGEPTPDTIVEFLHIDQSIGAEKWLSAEWACLLIDESSQIGEDDLRMLYSRVRVNEDVKEYWNYLADEREKIGAPRMDWHPLEVMASNPGGKSHAYLYENFVLPAREAEMASWEVRETIDVNGIDVETVIKRKFIPSFIADNPSLNLAQYAASLTQLAKERRQQLLSGDWDYFDGKAFPMLDPNVHYIDVRWPFDKNLVPPMDWPRIAGLDHGTTSPTAAIWVTRDEDGFFIAYLEYYSPGAVGTHINGIRSLTAMDGAPNIVFEADPRMWHKNRGLNRMWSIADEYAFGGEPPIGLSEAEVAKKNGIRLHQSKIERQAARIALQRLLEPQDDLSFPDWHPLAGRYGSPRLFIAQQCPNLWREMNGMQFEEGSSEDTVKVNDHAYDAFSRSAPVFEQQLAIYQSRRGGIRRQIKAG